MKRKFKVGDIVINKERDVVWIIEKVHSTYYSLQPGPNCREDATPGESVSFRYFDRIFELYQPYLNEMKIKKLLGVE